MFVLDVSGYGLYAEPVLKKCVIMTVILDFLNISIIFFIYQLRVVQTCSASSPSGNLVDGLPLVVNTGEEGIVPAPHR